MATRVGLRRLDIEEFLPDGAISDDIVMVSHEKKGVAMATQP